MNTAPLTDIDAPDIGLPSLTTIGNLIPTDEIGDIADSVVSRIARLAPWNRTRSRWRTTAFVTVAAAVAVAAAIAVARRRRDDTVDADDTSDPATIHRAA